MDDVTAALPRQNDTSGSDSDIELVGITQSPAQAKFNDRTKESSLSPRAIGKRPWNQGNKDSGRDGPSEAVLATWKRGDEDLEPSAKMLALVGLLKEWDSCGDKTICYSQCKRHPLAFYTSGYMLMGYRDIDAWSDRDFVFKTRDSEFEIRWKDEQGGEGCDIGYIQEAWGPKGHPYQVCYHLSGPGHGSWSERFPEAQNVEVSGMLSLVPVHRLILTSNFQPEPGFC
jgi:hypothetical protein